jgi:hypothetical protein
MKAGGDGGPDHTMISVGWYSSSALQAGQNALPSLGINKKSWLFYG